MLSPAINGTEQRLDAVLVELRGLHAVMDELIQTLQAPVPATTELVELREPRRRAKK